jgi:hypothetical protein
MPSSGEIGYELLARVTTWRYVGRRQAGTPLSSRKINDSPDDMGRLMWYLVDARANKQLARSIINQRSITMETMETVKFVALYGLEIIVVALVGVTLFAGLYQLIRDKARGRVSTPTTETARR